MMRRTIVPISVLLFGLSAAACTPRIEISQPSAPSTTRPPVNPLAGEPQQARLPMNTVPSTTTTTLPSWTKPTFRVTNGMGCPDEKGPTEARLDKHEAGGWVPGWGTRPKVMWTEFGAGMLRERQVGVMLVNCAVVNGRNLDYTASLGAYITDPDGTVRRIGELQHPTPLTKKLQKCTPTPNLANGDTEFALDLRCEDLRSEPVSMHVHVTGDAIEVS